MNRKKILFFIGQIGLGGSERQLSLVLKYFNSSFNNCSVIVFNHSPFGDLSKDLIDSNVNVKFIPENRKSIISRLIFLFSLIRQIKPDIIHSWTVHDNAYAGVIGLFFKNMKVYGSVRGSLKGTGFKKMSKILQLLSLRLVPKMIINSFSIKKELLDKGIKKDKIIMLKNYVALQPKTPSIIHKDQIICTIGNLRKNKNQSLFINAMKRVTEFYPNVKGFIIGQSVEDEPDIENKLNKLIKTLNMCNKIELLGFQQNTMKFLKRSTIFVLPSFKEGTPNTILEAMSLGIPVIASNVGGIPQIIEDGVNGILIQKFDSVELSDIIIELLGDFERQKYISSNARRYIELNHQPKHLKKQLEKVYEF